jgi:hypothetical protein
VIFVFPVFGYLTYIAVLDQLVPASTVRAEAATEHAESVKKPIPFVPERLIAESEGSGNGV